MKRTLVFALFVSFAAVAQQSAPAEQPAAAQPAAAQPAAPVQPAAAAPADQGISSDGKMHIDAAIAFLKAWGKGHWDELKPVSADKVAVKVGDKSYDLDVLAQKSDVKPMLPFRGLSTVRDQGTGKVVAISVSDLSLKGEGAEKHGKARLSTEDKEGQVRVTAVEME
ncbi:MAG TPA: hypothetical protein VG496_03120 [Myxococcales bacterium]|nr:hypothetical protein [Myxococcales bacterium]